MPTYVVTAPDGRKLKITGDTPPTDADLDDIFGQQGPEVGGSEAMEERAPSTGLDTAIGQVLTGGVMPEALSQQVGRGAGDASAKMLLTARQIFGAEPDAPAIREQLQPEGGAEAVGQMAPSAALAAATGGSSVLGNAAVGGTLAGLESGDPMQALKGAAMSGGLTGAMRGLASAAEGPLLRSIDKSLEAAGQTKMGMLQKIMGAAQGAQGLANVASGRMVRGGKQLLDAVSILPKFNELSANAKVNLLNTLRSGNESEIMQAVWRLLPSIGQHRPAEISDMKAEADRRRNANSVIR